MHIDPTSLSHRRLHMLIVATAFAFVAVEYGLGRLAHRDLFDFRESAASLAMAVGQAVFRGLGAFFIAIPFAFVWQHHLFSFDQTSLPALLGLFVGTEFLYYWHHRAMHRIRWLWATHCVHHSATRLNLSAALRLGWTGNISGKFLFFLPLVWIGFHPLAVTAMLAINLHYQFFIHTELIPRLGPLEQVLNTPANHRVHHAANATCLDRNFGGILIVFDRLFGTFAEAPKDEALRYGLVDRRPTFNPLRIAYGEWASMFGDVRRASSLRRKFGALLSVPASTQATAKEVDHAF